MDSRLCGVLALFLIAVIIGFCIWQRPRYTIVESSITGGVIIKKSDGTVVTNVDPKTLRAHHIWVR